MQANLTTPWTVLVNHTSVATSAAYPRLQLQRPATGADAGIAWLPLKGEWQFQQHTAGDSLPIGEDLTSLVLVPFPVDSLLSGLSLHGATSILYRHTLQVKSTGLCCQLNGGLRQYGSAAFCLVQVSLDRLPASSSCSCMST